MSGLSAYAKYLNNILRSMENYNAPMLKDSDPISTIMSVARDIADLQYIDEHLQSVGDDPLFFKSDDYLHEFISTTKRAIIEKAYGNQPICQEIIASCGNLLDDSFEIQLSTGALTCIKFADEEPSFESLILEQEEVVCEKLGAQDLDLLDSDEEVIDFSIAPKDEYSAVFDEEDDEDSDEEDLEDDADDYPQPDEDEDDDFDGVDTEIVTTPDGLEVTIEGDISGGIEIDLTGETSAPELNSTSKTVVINTADYPMPDDDEDDEEGEEGEDYPQPDESDEEDDYPQPVDDEDESESGELVDEYPQPDEDEEDEDYPQPDESDEEDDYPQPDEDEEDEEAGDFTQSESGVESKVDEDYPQPDESDEEDEDFETDIVSGVDPIEFASGVKPTVKEDYPMPDDEEDEDEYPQPDESDEEGDDYPQPDDDEDEDDYHQPEDDEDEYPQPSEDEDDEDSDSDDYPMPDDDEDDEDDEYPQPDEDEDEDYPQPSDDEDDEDLDSDDAESSNPPAEGIKKFVGDDPFAGFEPEEFDEIDEISSRDRQKDGQSPTTFRGQRPGSSLSREGKLVSNRTPASKREPLPSRPPLPKDINDEVADVLVALSDRLRDAPKAMLHFGKKLREKGKQTYEGMRVDDGDKEQ